MDDAIPGQVGLDYIRKVVEPGRGSKPGDKVPPWSLLPFLPLRSCTEVPS